MHTVWVVEDDAQAAAATRDMLMACPHAGELRVSRIDASALPQAVAMSAPDIVFMDIELGDDASGIDLVAKLFPEGSSTQVIYVTGHMEYCTDVYQTDHVSFLVKPLSQHYLDAAVARAVERVEKARGDVLVVRSGGATHIVRMSEVEYVESRLRKAYIHAGDRVVEAYMTLNDLERRLPSTFLRCHQSFLANMDLISAIHGNKLSMRSGAVVPVSQGRRQASLARIVEHAGVRAEG